MIARIAHAAQQRAENRAESLQRADDVRQQLANLRQALEGRQKALGVQLAKEEVCTRRGCILFALRGCVGG